ncbi:MAG TPA: DUF1697 domain-containing protein [Acidimicrobiales bacterium]|nr:DUF1697 domain-containing protein [Acidimicrobiales bacterium]
MSTHVALLRGINVGGRTKVPMKALRTVFEAMGYIDVTTYIQSGNVVFDATEAPTSDAIEARIAEAFGFDVAVVLRTAKELAAVIPTNPFPADTGKVHVVFLHEAPVPSAFARIDVAAFEPEEFALGRKELYLHLPNGVGTSKLAAALVRQAAPEATMRNWRTVETLVDLSRR